VSVQIADCRLKNEEREAVTARPAVTVWPGRWAIVRLEPDAPLPGWTSLPAPLTVVARTAAELSVVTLETHVPEECRSERGFRVLAVDGPIAFTVSGVIAGLTAPLAAAGISVFPIATYDTDYLLVRDEHLDRAVEVLRAQEWPVRVANWGTRELELLNSRTPDS
jgi:hypothetical protein